MVKIYFLTIACHSICTPKHGCCSKKNSKWKAFNNDQCCKRSQHSYRKNRQKDQCRREHTTMKLLHPTPSLKPKQYLAFDKGRFFSTNINLISLYLYYIFFWRLKVEVRGCDWENIENMCHFWHFPAQFSPSATMTAFNVGFNMNLNMAATKRATRLKLEWRLNPQCSWHMRTIPSCSEHAHSNPLSPGCVIILVSPIRGALRNLF